jgi:hypothetical protein
LVFLFWIATRGKNMKRILLTTTSLVLAGGMATAEASLTWSGTAAAGIAREGKVAGVATQITASMIGDLTLDFDAAMDHMLSAHAAVVHNAATDTAAELRADIAAATAMVNTPSAETETGKASTIAALEAITAILDAGDSTAVTAVATSEFETYSEVNATVTGSVTTDGGMTLSASVSVDAGKGYDFADDDGYDAAAARSITLDSVSIDTGSMGKITIDENAVTHLVDADDDANADVLYTNTFGAISFSAAADLSGAKDVDDNAVKAVAAVVTESAAGASAGGTAITTAGVAAVAADVQWSAKISMPVTGGTAYLAMDEEGGNAFGATATLGGVGISFDSKLEALEEELSIDRSNTIGLTYAMGATTFGATWNSVEDGDQWGISAAYAADGMTISASTDEGSDWSVSGSMALGNGASMVAGTNYTEDAYVGVSFAF